MISVFSKRITRSQIKVMKTSTNTQTDRIDFRQFYLNNRERGYRFALGYMDECNAEDVVEDVFLRLLEKQECIDTNRNLESLFMTMVRNKCLDHLRHEVYEKRYRHDRKALGVLYADELTSKISHEQLMQVVCNGLCQFDERARRIFVSIRLREESYKEVAKRMGLTTRSVEYNINKSTKMMRDYVRRHYDLTA